MNPRENMMKVLRHETPGWVPIDFGSTATTGIHISCVAALRDHYGLEKRAVKVYEPYQMLGWIDEDLKEAMGIDTEGLYPHKTLFGFCNENWREFLLPWGQEVLVSEHFNTTVDKNGDLLLYPEGDLEAPPSGRMAVSSAFFDTIIRQPTLDDNALNPEDNCEEFTDLSPEDEAHFAEEVRRLEGSRRVRVGTLGGTGFGDIALVPAPFLKHPRGIRDIEEWYISTLTRQDYVHAIFEAQCEVALRNLEACSRIVGDAIDVLFVCGTDFGTQTSTFCSTDTFDSLYAPYYRRVNDWVHRHTEWKTMKHSCGAVGTFLSHFIEAGFDIVNPVQCSARGMDSHWLKREFGEQLTFWGGGVDTQKTLPFGQPDEVRAEVLSRCETYAPNGGFVFNAVHNIQMHTPLPNMIAMIDAVREFNG
ncbi:MAG: methyltransferase [bacterium]|nr:methyltransferase [bacterium]